MPFSPASVVSFLLVCGFATSGLFAQPYAPAADPAGGKVLAPRPRTFNPDLKPFYHGVASGDPSTDGFVIWTRVTPEQGGPVSVSYKVATDPEFENIVAEGMADADESHDYTVKIVVSGLQPGTAYFYYFSALGANSLVGRARTTPADSVDHLRFAVVSCSNWEGGYFNAYGMIAQRNDLDAVLHLGDYIYEYGAGVYSVSLPDRINDPPNELLDLSDYRTRYALYRLDANLIRLHQQHTMISVWDDHESANGSYTDGASNHQPNEGDWALRKAISKQVYFEWMPVRDQPDQEVYRAFSYGDLCDLIMLDTRLEGRDMPPPEFDTPDNPPRAMMSQAQFEWLTGRLKSAAARWKVLGNQVLFSNLNVGFAAGPYDGVPDPTNLDSIRQAERVFIDTWESYPTQRNAVIDSIRFNAIDNVVFVTGDSHASWAFDVNEQPVLYPPVPTPLNLPQANPYNPTTGKGYNKSTGDGSRAVELAGPSISSPNFDEAIGATLAAQLETLINQPIPPINIEYNPHLKYVDLDRHGYFLLDLKPDTLQADYYYIPTQYVDTLAESFGAGVIVADERNRIGGFSATPSAPKSVQDPETPRTPFGTVGVGTAAPALALFGIYPNPVQDYAILHFGVNHTTAIEFALYDRNGRTVRRITGKSYAPGLYRFGLELGTLPAGAYILSLESPGRLPVSRQIIVP